LIDLLRKEKLRSTQELSDTFISASNESEKIIYKEQLDKVMTAMQALPTQSRRVFELSRLEDLSHKEISSQLSISTKTVENHITKAVKHLKSNFALFFPQERQAEREL
jgi:RNA polymerase sigma-70 factor (ECF subfamily)